MQQGMGSKVSPLWAELAAADTRRVPVGLTATGNHQPEPRPIPYTRYTDPDYARLEGERLWLRTWQFACRLEDIPNPGDRFVYDVGATLSLLVVRESATVVRAYHNVCRHRGTRLASGGGSATSIRCPFHGWQWRLDGSLESKPCAWDFQHVPDSKLGLIPAQVGVWEGFVFVNPDASAPPLLEALGDLPRLFGERGHARRFTVAHVSKKVRANWKTVLEAFLESYHVIQTHADALSFTGDANTSYDIWHSPPHGHVSRLITPTAIPSPHLGDDASVAAAAQGVASFIAAAMPGVPAPTIDALHPNGRAQLAAWRRHLLQAALGHDYANHSDSEMLDAVQYHLFPNFGVWFGEGLPLVYQFLPLGDDPNESVFNVRLTADIPAGAPCPPPVPVTQLDFDTTFTEGAPQFGALAHVFDQDLQNLPNIQRGMRCAPAGAARPVLGRYMEQRIQYFHNVLADRIGG